MPPDSKTETPPSSVGRAWYAAGIGEFLGSEPDLVLGRLALNSTFSILPSQRDAWRLQIEGLRRALGGLEGRIFLEFVIPRMGRRVDAILLLGEAVFVLEFKIGFLPSGREATEQVWDYSLDLKNFHEGSHHAVIVPLVVTTEECAVPSMDFRPDPDLVLRPRLVHVEALRMVLDQVEVARASNEVGEAAGVDQAHWAESAYRPTPTIIDAARSLYARHSVQEIERCDAGKDNLRLTSQRIQELVEESRRTGRKRICFVTGVPGAGKTLVGLDLATRRRNGSEGWNAVYLSGNGPLVEVLREALTRDEYERRKSGRVTGGRAPRKGEIRSQVKAFIQPVHHFRDEGLRNETPPHERVVVFDEAQRAWDRAKLSEFMRVKAKRPAFDQSEPEVLLSYMDRHEGWAVVVCLVGGGQEIHRGEAGITAWIEAVQTRFPHWEVHISPRLTDREYGAGKAVSGLGQMPTMHFDDCLHLAVSRRSFRAEGVSAFVKAVLDGEGDLARKAWCGLGGRYPIVLTRNLDQAKQWVRDRARGSERFGLVASSKASRLKPLAIDIRVAVDPVVWFLNERSDVSSSFYLEDVATEFQVQGLELDWVCVTWDGDLRRQESAWNHHDFRGDRWVRIQREVGRDYLLNAYRVLLTRARQGMAIIIPRGDPADPTRQPSFYDATFQYLAATGIPVLA